MSCLEVRKMAQSTKLCEACLVEKGPSRSGRFKVFLCGHPAAEVCEIHRRAWVALFTSDEEKAA